MARWEDKDDELEDLNEEEDDGGGVEVDWLGGLVGFEVLGACELIVGNWVLLNSRVEYWVCTEKCRWSFFDSKGES